MTTSLLLAAVLLAGCGGNGGEGGEQAAGDQATQEIPELTQLDSGVQEMSYALGMDLAGQVGRMPGSEDHESLLGGVQQHLAGDAKLDAAQAGNILQQQASGVTDTTAFEDPDFASREERTAYALGVSVAAWADAQFDTMDTGAMLAGLQSQLAGEQTLISPDTTRAIVTAYLEKQRASAGEANRAAGEAFLETNAQRPEVTVTDSGLQYEVLEEGDGATPEASNTVTVHYRGTLIDGTEFDSSYSRGEPATFPLNGVISGWTEGLQLMPVGSKYKFYVPADLAYGDRGAGQQIKPGATLIFEVELLEIEE
jgi:FKBP-type peptidyl-prolyl cis-trans isomerase